MNLPLEICFMIYKHYRCDGLCTLCASTWPCIDVFAQVCHTFKIVKEKHEHALLRFPFA